MADPRDNPLYGCHGVPRRQRPDCSQCGRRLERAMSSSQRSTPSPRCKVCLKVERDTADDGFASRRLARYHAHVAFDSLWQPGGLLTRREAYRWMQLYFGLSEDAAHIRKFTVEQCRALVVAVHTVTAGFRRAA